MRHAWWRVAVRIEPPQQGDQFPSTVVWHSLHGFHVEELHASAEKPLAAAVHERRVALARKKVATHGVPWDACATEGERTARG